MQFRKDTEKPKQYIIITHMKRRKEKKCYSMEDRKQNNLIKSDK